AHTPKLSKTTRLLICMAVGEHPKTLAIIKTIAGKIGVGLSGWNVSSLLSASAGALKTSSGWELSPTGRKEIQTLAGPLVTTTPPPAAATSLRSHLPGIANSDTRAFVEEAISCYEHKLYRAAVVLTWIGAVSLLYDFVITNKSKLADFNTEATTRYAKKK